MKWYLALTRDQVKFDHLKEFGISHLQQAAQHQKTEYDKHSKLRTETWQGCEIIHSKYDSANVTDLPAGHYFVLLL